MNLEHPSKAWLQTAMERAMGHLQLRQCLGRDDELKKDASGARGNMNALIPLRSFGNNHVKPAMPLLQLTADDQTRHQLDDEARREIVAIFLKRPLHLCHRETGVGSVRVVLWRLSRQNTSTSMGPSTLGELKKSVTGNWLTTQLVKQGIERYCWRRRISNTPVSQAASCIP